MWTRLAPLLLLASALPAIAESPIADVICAPRAEMVQKLTQTYGSNMSATGIRDIEAVMEVWTTPSGRWTLVQTYTDGQSCIVAMGEAWDMPLPPKAG